MRKMRKIHLNDNDFIIEYNSNKTDLTQINKMNCGELIWVLLEPKKQLKEHKGIEAFKLAENELFREIKNIINDNISFYKNFNIEYTFNRKSLDLYREFPNIFLEKMHAYLKIEMKD